MGWLWGTDADTSKTQETLDPSLREFLEKEALTVQKPTLPAKPAAKPAETTTPTYTDASETPIQRQVPPQSQFQDGRYAHLWKNYTPQNILDDRSKSEQDKLRDIVDAYNDRKSSIGRVALENCALEYMEQFECFKNPSWLQASTVCRAESRKFNRCYDIQSKFLKALGYLTMEIRTQEQDEAIQMHADRLYQQMMEQEALIEKAKEEGRPIPQFESVLSKQNVSRAMSGKPSSTASHTQFGTDQEEEDNIWSRIKADSRKEYEKKLSELPPEEQDFERRALLGELKAQTGMAKKVEETFVEERISRMKRREAGQATIGDTIKRLWGWG